MLIDDYFKYQINYEKQYGENSIVLMEVGSFYEIYGIDNNTEKIGNLKKITELLNIQLTRRNKNILENNRENCLMAGFPAVSLNRYLKILVNNNYTSILIEQTTEPPHPKREVTKIISPGTDIEFLNVDSNCILSIYIEQEESKSRKIFSIGVSTIDLSTGISKVMSIYLNDYNINSLFEEIFRINEKFSPKELIISTNNTVNLTKQIIVENLMSNNIVLHININSIKKDYLNINFQNKFLTNFFEISSTLSSIEYLDLEKNISSTISLIILLDFVEQHDASILKKLKRPVILDDENNLILYNNSVHQLNLVSENSLSKDIKLKYKSLFDVINYTSTPFGKRLLKDRLLNPITNIDLLNTRYNKIEKLIDSTFLDDIEDNLKSVNDLERLNRKIYLNILCPFEFSNYYTSLFFINNILNNLKLIIQEDRDKIEEYEKLIDNFIHYSKIRFNIDIMSKYNINNIEENIFNKDIYNEIDEIDDNIKEINDNIVNESKDISGLIEKNSNYVKIENTEKDSINFVLTKKRYEQIENKLSKNYIIKKNNNNVKICSTELINNTNTINSLKCKLREIVKDKYITEVSKISNIYIKMLEELVDYIAEIDFILSGTKLAIESNYCKPTLLYSENSYINSKSVRHPIIEKLNILTKYVENDINLNSNNTGILLYGINGVGKSSLSKAIGLNIILAQIGYYVAADYFELMPYKKLFTRINGDDNLFKGQSSFIVEMLELRSILKFSDKNSIVLGDEICKGTEESSAVSIVSSSILYFAKNKINFIFATHLHKLYQIDSIKNIENISFKHLKVDFKDNQVIYNRKIYDGPGESIYGLNVAKNIILDTKFIEESNKIMKELKEEDNIKKCKYNSKYFYNSCEICGEKKDLDVHHIIHQKDFKNKDFNKNTLSNLVTLCKKHHNDVHNGYLNIYGYLLSLGGLILNYEYVEKKNTKKKYDKNKIEIINSFKDKNIDYVIKTLKIDYDIKICKGTILKIWNNIY